MLIRDTHPGNVREVLHEFAGCFRCTAGSIISYTTRNTTKMASKMDCLITHLRELVDVCLSFNLLRSLIGAALKFSARAIDNFRFDLEASSTLDFLRS